MKLFCYWNCKSNKSGNGFWFFYCFMLFIVEVIRLYGMVGLYVVRIWCFFDFIEWCGCGYFLLFLMLLLGEWIWGKWIKFGGMDEEDYW